MPMKKEERMKSLLNFLQEDFPLVSEPFKLLAEKFKVDEDEIIKFLKDLKKRKIIRHLGATVDSHKLGYITCLCATSIPEDKIEIAYKIAELPEITHAYIREHQLNFWFTVVVKSKKDLDKICNLIKTKFHLEVKKFPAVKKFKVKAVFKI